MPADSRFQLADFGGMLSKIADARIKKQKRDFDQGLQLEQAANKKERLSLDKEKFEAAENQRLFNNDLKLLDDPITRPEALKRWKDRTGLDLKYRGKSKGKRIIENIGEDGVKRYDVENNGSLEEDKLYSELDIDSQYRIRQKEIAEERLAQYKEKGMEIPAQEAAFEKGLDKILDGDDIADDLDDYLVDDIGIAFNELSKGLNGIRIGKKSYNLDDFDERDKAIKHARRVIQGEDKLFDEVRTRMKGDDKKKTNSDFTQRKPDRKKVNAKTGEVIYTFDGGKTWVKRSQ